MQLLAESELSSKINDLNGWVIHESNSLKAIQKEFTFAFGLITKVAILVEKANYHPDLLNSYNKVKIALTTHGSGGIIQYNLDLARASDGALQ